MHVLLCNSRVASHPDRQELVGCPDSVQWQPWGYLPVHAWLVSSQATCRATIAGHRASVCLPEYLKQLPVWRVSSFAHLQCRYIADSEPVNMGWHH